MSNLPTEAYPGHCSVEIFRRRLPGNVVIDYWVAETRPTPDFPYPDPVDIISWDQTYFVVVDITLEDPVRRHFCGSLCVDIDVDTCGPAPDLQFDEQTVLLDPCGDGKYRVVLRAASRHVHPGPAPLRSRVPDLRHDRLPRSVCPAQAWAHLGPLRLPRDRRPSAGAKPVALSRPVHTRSAFAGRGIGSEELDAAQRRGGRPWDRPTVKEIPVRSMAQISGQGSKGRRQQAGFSVFLDQVVDAGEYRLGDPALPRRVRS